jgi:hypothetical protein
MRIETRKIVIDLACRWRVPSLSSGATGLFWSLNTRLIAAEGFSGRQPKIWWAVLGVLAAQVRVDLLVEALPGITGGHRNPDFANRHTDLRTDLQQFCADRRYLGLRQLSPFQAQSS